MLPMRPYIAQTVGADHSHLVSSQALSISLPVIDAAQMSPYRAPECCAEAESVSPAGVSGTGGADNTRNVCAGLLHRPA